MISLYKRHRPSLKHEDRIDFVSRKPTENLEQRGAPAFYLLQGFVVSQMDHDPDFSVLLLVAN